MLNYQELGQGQPVILLHGFLGSSQNWLSYARYLSDRYNVFCVDLRNHGWSFHSDDCSYDAMTADVEELIAAYSLYEPIVIGHSMGGKVAMQLASNLSEQIQKLVVEDIAPRQYDNRHGDILDALFRLSLDGAEALGQLDKALAVDIPDKHLRGFLLQNLSRDAGEFKWKLNLPALRQHVDAITAAPTLEDDIEVPCLFVRGEYSDYIQLPQDEQLIASHFINYDIVTIPKTGHWVHGFALQEFAKAVDDFLEK